MSKKYEYLVFYIHTPFGFGTANIIRNSEISSIEDLISIAKDIENNSKEKIKDIGIASYQLICVREEESDTFTEEEQEEIFQELSDKWIGKVTPEGTYIKSIYVDCRKDRQDMNRVADEYGNIFFISELEDIK